MPLRKPLDDQLAIWEAVGELARALQVSEPLFQWNPKGGKRSFYYPGKGLIRMTGNTWFGANDIGATLCHEFAHHVAWTRYKCRGHGREFVHCLKEVIQVWYGNQREYPWNREYKRVACNGPGRDAEDMLKELE